MNPLRELWRRAENLAGGLFDKTGTFLVNTQTYDDETQVHGFFRRVASDGETEKGFGFYCPVRGASDPMAHLKPGDHMKHCGREDVLDTEAFLPTVRMKPRIGRWQISSDGTQAMPTDALDEFNGEFEYEQSDPAKGG